MITVTFSTTNVKLTAVMALAVLWSGETQPVIDVEIPVVWLKISFNSTTNYLNFMHRLAIVEQPYF